MQVDELRSWRRTAAHDIKYYNEITKESLAARSCKDDFSMIVSTGQRDLSTQLSQYLGKNGDGKLFSGNASEIFDGARGPMMCVLAMFSFLLTIAKELNKTAR